MRWLLLILYVTLLLGSVGHAASVVSGFPQASQPLGNIPDAVLLDQGTGCPGNVPPCTTSQSPSLRVGQPFQSTVAPGTPFKYQLWWDTTVSGTPKLKIYDGSTWNLTGTLDTTAHTWTPPGDIRLLAVIGSHTATGGWVFTGPNGTAIDASGDQCEGLQAAVNYAYANAYALQVYGGGIAPGNHEYSRINCTDTLVIPTGWGNHTDIYGVQIWGQVVPPTHPLMTIDSSDFTWINWHNSEWAYFGTDAAIHLLPTKDNGEGQAGFTSSTFSFGNVVCVTALGAPQHSYGTGIRISAPALDIGSPNDNGGSELMYINAPEINGCAIGIQLDNPGGVNPGGGPDSLIAKNTFDFPSIHDSGTGIKIGTSPAAAHLIVSNHWKAIISAVDINLDTYGSGDLYTLSIGGGTSGIIQEDLGADCTTLTICEGNTYIESYNQTITPFTNNCSGVRCMVGIRVTNVGGPTRVVGTCGASPYVVQNTALKPMFILVSGAAAFTLGVSADGSTYDTFPDYETTGNFIAQSQLVPGMFYKVTYSGAAPTCHEYY